jgi:carbon storage regulator
MLVLSRKPNEAIIINDAVRVTVVGIKGDRVRLGIEAPRAVSVDRAEVHDRKMQFVDVPFASAVCDVTVDLGGVLVATADDTRH